VSYHWDFEAVWRHRDLLWAGALGTFRLFGCAFLLAVPLGIVLTLLRLARSPVLSWSARAYIEIFRTAPAIVLIYWFFFAFPTLTGITFGTLVAATIALGLQAAAFFAEVFRAGIESIARGQWEAAGALGMGYGSVMRDIILPQALRRILPIFFTRTTELFKATSLAATIAYAEIVQQASLAVSQSFRPIETFTVVAAFFFIVIFIASQLMRAWEWRLSRAG